jgi:hypothetical protein
MLVRLLLVLFKGCFEFFGLCGLLAPLGQRAVSDGPAD